MSVAFDPTPVPLIRLLYFYQPARAYFLRLPIHARRFRSGLWVALCLRGVSWLFAAGARNQRRVDTADELGHVPDQRLRK